MFSRRLLRIKVLQILYAHFKASGKTYFQSEKDLIYSLTKSYELYHYLMLLILEISDYAQSKIEMSKMKNIPTWEDMHPNTKFIDNLFIKQIRNNHYLEDFTKKKKLSWRHFPDIIKNLYSFLIKSDLYKEYLSNPGNTYSEDKKLVLKIYSDIIMNDEDLYRNLEDQNIYWIDDIDFIFRVVIKTFKHFREGKEYTQLLPIFQDKEDLEYAKKLLRNTIEKHEENNSLIKNSVKNWELERIAFTDYLLIQMAITEVVGFKSIPVKVTMNEFIEISKIFSTSKSSKFINGILESVFAELKKEKKIIKEGRGLIGETDNNKN
jgi:N utilization substance protein B